MGRKVFCDKCLKVAPDNEAENWMRGHCVDELDLCPPCKTEKKEIIKKHSQAEDKELAEWLTK